MKEILIDLYKIKNQYSGLGQYSLNFAKELIKYPIEDIKINFLIPKNTKIKFDPNINTIHGSILNRFFPNTNKNYVIWHSLNQFPSFLPSKKAKYILTIHDLNFLIEKKSKKKNKYLKNLQKNIDRADYIVTISNYTKTVLEENINLKGKKIKVIYNGISLVKPKHIVKPKFIGNKKFFFSISLFSRKKNFHVLLYMMKYFDDFQLIIAGDNNTKYGKEIIEQIAKLKLNHKVILPGIISDSDKYWLYENCEAFLFPSIAEGFGMPVVEAMKLGKPVFLSKYTSLAEIGGDLSFYFDSFDSVYMSSFIKKELENFSNDNEKQSNKIIKYADKFTWEKCIHEYIDIYNKILT